MSVLLETLTWLQEWCGIARLLTKNDVGGHSRGCVLSYDLVANVCHTISLHFYQKWTFLLFCQFGLLLLFNSDGARRRYLSKCLYMQSCLVSTCNSRNEVWVGCYLSYIWYTGTQLFTVYLSHSRTGYFRGFELMLRHRSACSRVPNFYQRFRDDLHERIFVSQSSTIDRSKITETPTSTKRLATFTPQIQKDKEKQVHTKEFFI